MAKSKGRFLADLIGATGLVRSSKSDLAGADGIIELSVLPSLPNSKLTNTGITLGGTTIALGASSSTLGAIALTGPLTTNSTIDGIDIATRDAVLTSTTTTAGAALPKAGGTMTGALNMGSNNITTTGKMLFANMYSAEGDLPSASTYHGMFAHVHGTGKGYYAHAGAWIPIAKETVLTSTTTIASAALPKAGGAMTGAITTNSTFDGVDIAVRDAVLTSTTTTANAAAPLNNPTLTGTPAAPTASGSTSTTQLATTAFVQQELTTLIGGAPSTLNDLNELAAAINDDANYNSTLTTALATKAPLASPTFTGTIKMQSNGAYFRDGVGNSLSSGWDATGDDHATWINFEGYQGGTTKFRDLRIGNGKQAAFVHFDGSAASVAISGALTATGLTVDTSAGQLDVEALGGSSVKVKSDGSLKIEATGGSVSLINGSTEVLSTTSTGIDVTGDIEVRSGNKLILQRPNNAVASNISTDSTGAMILDSLNSEGFFFNNNGTNAFKIDPINATFAGTTTSTGLTVSTSQYNKINSYFSGSYISGFKFSDLNGGIWYDAGADDLTISAGHANSQLIMVSGGSERMRIDSSGNVKIGDATTQITSKLTVSGNASSDVATFMYDGAAGTYFDIDCNEANGVVNLRADARSGNYPPLTFTTGGSERMRISSAGNVSMTVDLTVGNSYLSNNYASFANMRINNNAYIGSAHTPSAVQIQTGGAVAFGYDVTVPNISVADDIRHTGDSDTYMSFENNFLGFYTGGQNNLKLSSGVSTFTPSSGETLVIARDSAGPYIGLSSNHNLRLIANNSERLRVGTNARLSINGSATTNGHGNFVGEVGANSKAIMFEHTVGGGEVGSIVTSSSSTSYGVGSDYRLKENVVPMTGSIDRVKALKPSRFNFIVDADKTVDGFLAHEAQVVVPESVTGTKDAMRDEEYEVTAAVEEVRDEDDNITTEATEAVMGTRSVPDMQGIDQAKLVPLLVAALQEAIARIEILEGA